MSQYTWSLLVRLCVKADEEGSCNIQALEQADAIIDQVNDIGIRQSTPLHFVALGTNVSLGKWLLSKGAIFRQNEDGETPLHWACKIGCTEMVQVFISEMSFEEIHLCDYNGDTASDWAKEYENKEIVEILNLKSRKAKTKNLRKSLSRVIQTELSRFKESVK